jgi:hypothetical protein
VPALEYYVDVTEDNKKGNFDLFALEVADKSWEWYRTAAVRSRKSYRSAEVGALVVSASIPVAAVISPKDALVPAILGAVVVVISGLRALFHWQDNYLRFSAAREAIENERRLFRTRAKPYGDEATRSQTLVEAVSRIESEEMATWLRISRRRSSEE